MMNEQNRIKRMLYISVAIIVMIIVLYTLINAVQISQRETYASEDLMRIAMQGKWTHYANDSGLSSDAMWQIEIVEDNAYMVYPDEDDQKYSFDIKWNPKKGMFSFAGWEVIVEKGGRMLKEKSRDRIYFKGGTLNYSKFSERSTTPVVSESAANALKFSNLTVYSNSVSTICSGTLTNTGKKTYKFVEVKGAFKNTSGTVLDTDSTYAVGSEGLAPGESKTFKLYVDKNYQISTCTVTIYDYK